MGINVNKPTVSLHIKLGIDTTFDANYIGILTFFQSTMFKVIAF